ncbi:MAG: hypothetical protein WCO56_29490 [Verrucomicrobiota bacterium]
MANEIGKKLLSALDKAIGTPARSWETLLADITSEIGFTLTQEEKARAKDLQAVADRVWDAMAENGRDAVHKNHAKALEKFRNEVAAGKTPPAPTSWDDAFKAAEAGQEAWRSVGESNAIQVEKWVVPIWRRWADFAEQLAQKVESENQSLSRWLPATVNADAGREIRDAARKIRARADRDSGNYNYAFSPRRALEHIVKI